MKTIHQYFPLLKNLHYTVLIFMIHIITPFLTHGYVIIGIFSPYDALQTYHHASTSPEAILKDSFSQLPGLIHTNTHSFHQLSNNK